MAWSEIFRLQYAKTPWEFHLHGLCDLQIGSSSTILDMVKMRVEEICEDPFDSGVIIPGDIEDEDRPSTRAIRKGAFAGREEVIYRDAEKHMAYLDKFVIPILLPLQKTKFGIMGILAGHHWTQISPVLNSVQYICQEIGRLSHRKVNYLGEMSCFLDLRFLCSNGNALRRTVHVQHGEGGGQTKAASLNKLDKTSQGFIADCYIRAHDCQIVASKFDQLYPKELKDGESDPVLLAKHIAVLNLGSATRGYEMGKGPPSYIESKMMRPTAMGWGTLLFKIRKARSWEDPQRNAKIEIKIQI